MTFIKLKEIKKEIFWKFEGDQNKSPIKKVIEIFDERWPRMVMLIMC